jgi:hypothetical protein
MKVSARKIFECPNGPRGREKSFAPDVVRKKAQKNITCSEHATTVVRPSGNHTTTSEQSINEFKTHRN